MAELSLVQAYVRTFTANMQEKTLSNDAGQTNVPREGSEVSVDANQLWQTALADLEKKISTNPFGNYFRNTTLHGIEGDTAIISVPNPISLTTLESRYASQIERTLFSILGRKVKATFVVSGRQPEAEKEPARMRHPVPARPTRAPEAEPPARRITRPSQNNAGLNNRQLPLQPSAHGLNPRLVYGTYVVGSSNRFAHAASLAVAEHPGLQVNNPFFVHGGVGLGKTHLMHAIGHRALEIQPDLTIIYASSEAFTNDVINAIRSGRMEEFRTRYRSIDILMIDDVQFIAGKDSTQEEFFHTFNALYQNGKQIVITSDKPPKSIAALEERMRSRFNGGLVADVQSPDYEMRTAIIRSKADEFGIRIGDDIIEYIASKDQTNIRELEGALNKILMMAHLYNRPLSLQLAMEALTDATMTGNRGTINTTQVIAAVEAYFNVSEKDLIGRQRKREIVMPRQIAMFLMREATESSLVDIGRALGGRDHTTVLHGVEKIEQLLETDTQLRTQVMSIRETLLTGRR